MGDGCAHCRVPGAEGPTTATGFLIGAPLIAVVLYGIVRITMTLLAQVREGLFATVALNAVRKLALSTFEHMHRLSLRFHLERKTGGLTRVLERGRAGIEQITRMLLMVLLPTVVEFVLVLVICAIEFDWRYVVVISLMIVGYLWFTIEATEWRVQIRRQMNESDTEANTKAVDSLLNYETVKYFGAERREAERYDKSMAQYEKASVKTYTSLAFLNSGQAVIFTIALTLCMVMSARDVMAGTNSVGQFIMVNALMLQLFIPLNFMGTLYREIRQSLTDIERMMTVLNENPEVADRPGSEAVVVSGGTVRSSTTSSSPTRRGAPFWMGSPSKSRRQDGRHCRAVGRRQIDDQPHSTAVLRRRRRQRRQSTGRTSAT